MRQHITHIMVFALLAVGALGTALPPAQAQSCNARVTFVNDSNFPQVAVSVSVTDASGQPIRTLSSGSFDLRENNQRANVTIAGDAAPFTAILVVDLSGSMDGAKLSQARAAARDFVAQMRPGDQVGLLPFADNPLTFTPPTTSQSRLNSVINSFQAGGGTAFFDAVDDALDALDGRSGRRLVIAMTDGGDNDSTISSTALRSQISQVNQTDQIDVITIGFGASPNEYDAPTLRSIASAPSLYFQANGSNIQAVYATIFAQVSNEYVLQYTSPAPSANGVERNISVQATCPSGVASATGRYNPGGVLPGVSESSNLGLLVPALAAMVAGLLALLFVPRLLSRSGAAAADKGAIKGLAKPRSNTPTGKSSGSGGNIKLKPKGPKKPPPPNIR